MPIHQLPFLSKTKYLDVDKKAIVEFLSELKYPLYFLGFETINPAIPVYDNTRPFEAIPFQYSLHIVKKASSCKT